MKAIILALCLAPTIGHVAPIDENRLLAAIRVEEGCNPHFWYGIHHAGSQPLPESEARRRCLNTIRHAERDFRGGDFITFLSHRYCPANQQSWNANVHRLYFSLKNS